MKLNTSKQIRKLAHYISLFCITIFVVFSLLQITSHVSTSVMSNDFYLQLIGSFLGAAGGAFGIWTISTIKNVKIKQENVFKILITLSTYLNILLEYKVHSCIPKKNELNKIIQHYNDYKDHDLNKAKQFSVKYVLQEYKLYYCDTEKLLDLILKNYSDPHILNYSNELYALNFYLIGLYKDQTELIKKIASEESTNALYQKIGLEPYAPNKFSSHLKDYISQSAYYTDACLYIADQIFEKILELENNNYFISATFTKDFVKHRTVQDLIPKTDPLNKPVNSN